MLSNRDLAEQMFSCSLGWMSRLETLQKTILCAVAILGLFGCSGSSDNNESPNRPDIGGVSQTTSEVQEVQKEVSDQDTSSTALQVTGTVPSSPIFRDATTESGIDFVHFNGITGEFFLPEITGSGGALFDYDNDGDLDLYLVQGAKLLSRPNPPGFAWRRDGPPRDQLYRNDLKGAGGGALHFTDVTRQSGIVALGYGMGVATADFNNDGWTDLYVTNLGSNQMLRNNGDGTFTDVTKQAGTDDPRWSSSATFLDYDKDGLPDLFVAGYVEFSSDMKRECYANTSARDYCGPDAYDAIVDRLFHNRGDGTFEDVTRTAGIRAAFGAGLGVIAADFNADGWTDIYVANDGDPNQLWINRGGRSFEDEALLAGVALNHSGSAEASMGVAVEDFDGDGDEDLFMTHLDGESNTFYVNLGNGFFEDLTIKVGLHSPSLIYTGFGTGFFDYDNDGWLDLLILNGAVRIMEPLARKGERYPLQQRNQLFRNTGRGNFVEVTDRAGDAFKVEKVSRGAAFGDVDNDGDTDAVVFNNNGRTRLLLNEYGNRGHWLGLRLLEKRTRQDALQARVEVVGPNGTVRWRRVHTDGSYCSAGDPRLLIGLGDHDEPHTLRVYWPSGDVEEWHDLAVDRYWVLRRGESPRGQTPR